MGPFANDRKLGDINNHQHIDIDAACFFTLSQYLSFSFKAIIRPCNRKVRLRDFEGFIDRLHAISDSVVIRVSSGDTNVERELTKVKILEALKISFGITLTRNSSSLILSKNRVNVSTIGMAKAIYISWARIFRVGFSSMKMPIGIVESLMDNLMQRYIDFIAL